MSQINVDDLISRVHMANAKQEQRKAESRARRVGEFRNCIDAIRSKQSDLRDIRRVVDAIYSHMRAGDTKPFTTEGLHHDVGFSRMGGCDNLWGVCGGGYSGKSVFFNVDTGKFVVCEYWHEDNTKAISDQRMIDEYLYDSHVLGHLYYMMNKLDAFIQEVSEYVLNM